MKKNLLLLSLVCSTALYSQTIKSIDLKNLTTISPDVVNETLDMKVSDELNFDKLNKALKKFYTFGYFDDIKFYNENGNITLEFTEKPSVVAVEIEGYKQREEELAAIRKAMKLDKGSLYTKAKIENAKQVLLDLLESEGYINSVVEAEIEEVNERSLKVTFSVNKGETIVITDAKYYGANELEQDDFDTVSANKPKEFASWFFGQNDGEVKIDQLQYDARRINELYFEKGFLDAKVK
ncbi:MAG: POTRA domain-containing protein, partial [Sulfurovum sp.]